MINVLTALMILLPTFAFGAPCNLAWDWTGDESLASHFQLYRYDSPTSNDRVPAGTAAPAVRSLQLDTCVPNDRFVLTVVSIDGTESADSNIVNVPVPILVAPSSLRIE